MNPDRQRVALVTGASSGIGHACALDLAQRGLRVYGVSRRVAPTDGAPAAVSMLAMDITDRTSVEQGVATILDREGRIDILVNNAGMGIAGPVETTSVEEAERQFDVNFFGAFRLCRAVLPVMRRQRYGYIVNIGSIGGVLAIPYQALYSASKFALEGFAEALRLEVRSTGVRVVVVEPGDYRTAFTQNRTLTAKSGDESEYLRPFRRALERMTQDEQAGPDPENIARLLYRILETKNPRLRYTTGKFDQRAAVWLKRFLPYSLIEAGMRKYYRL
jgi:NAD(P)-dependent dehydrogenase (short-subunit alcohol dehydrogenase family)